VKFSWTFTNQVTVQVSKPEEADTEYRTAVVDGNCAKVEALRTAEGVGIDAMPSV
jgi:hypothetical protein